MFTPTIVPALVTGQTGKTDNPANSTTVAVAFPGNITSGNLIIAVFGYGLDASLSGTPTQTVSSVLATSSRVTLTENKAQLTTGANGARCSFWSGIASSSGAVTITATFSASAWYATMHIYEFSGILASSYLDKVGATAPNATTSPTCVLDSATTQVGELCFAWIGFGGTAITGVSTGWTNGQRTFSLSSDYKIGTATSTESMNWGSATNVTNSNAIMVSYKHA